MLPSLALLADLRVREAALDNPECTARSCQLWRSVPILQMIKFDGAGRAPLSVHHRAFITEPSRMFATRASERLRLAGLTLDSEATSEDETYK